MPPLPSPSLLLATFASATLLLACTGKDAGEIEPLGDGVPAPLRAVMVEVDQFNWKIEPVVRLPSEFANVAAWARSIETMGADPAWGEYMGSDAFLGEREKFETYRSWLLLGSKELAEGAEASDVEQMRRGYIRLEQSCIACHKRYQPNI